MNKRCADLWTVCGEKRAAGRLVVSVDSRTPSMNILFHPESGVPLCRRRLFYEFFYYIDLLIKGTGTDVSVFPPVKKEVLSLKFQCDKADFVQAIQIASRAVASKPQTPILSGIHLKATGDLLELEATDYEIGIVCRVAADIEQEGESVVSGRYLQEVVRNLPEGAVTFEQSVEEPTIHIRSGASNFTLLGMAARDFPGVREIEPKVKFKIKDAAIK